MSAAKRTTAAVSVAALAAMAHGQASLQFLGQGIGVTNLSEDGSVAVGNTIADGVFETWRWVEGDEAGWQRLGRPTTPYTGSGAGGPQVSYDGSRVSATIIDTTLTAQTWGRWTNGLGWEQPLPPLPPDADPFPNSVASTWCLSGDGSTVGGFYWANATGGPFGSAARPAVWTDGVGVVGHDPMIPSSNARVNAVSYDGSICVGYSEDSFGSWMPTVWRGGSPAWLVTDYGAGNNWFLNANDISGNGDVIVGQVFNPAALRAEAGVWRWNGASYDETILGVLPGTPQTDVGQVWASSVTHDGSMIVGTNRFFDNGPFSTVTGFVWTEEEGMRDILDIMGGYGLSFPNELWVVHDMVVSPDGSTIAGIVLNQNTTAFLDYWSFIFRFPPTPECDGDVDGNGTTDVFDFATLAANFGAGPGATREMGDLTGDGFVDVFDFSELAGDFGCSVIVD